MPLGGNLLGSAGQYIGVQCCVPQHADLADTAVYLHFFCMTLEFAPFPQAARHPRAETLNIKSECPPWKWAVQQVRDFPPDPDWNRAGLIDKISVSFAKTIQVVGHCQGPLYFTTSMSVGPSESRRIIRMRRAEWTY